ncbi:hypothetical protein PFISCL1PPCAC_16698, partial [Pristionchus fissidentatus]
QYYWYYYKWQLFAGNVLGFCSMWLTVLMTVECYVHIFHPIRSKLICTQRNLGIVCGFLLAIGVVLALIYPLNRDPEILTDPCGKYVSLNSDSSPEWTRIEHMHTVANLIIALLMPIGLLVYMCIRITMRINRDTRIVETSKRHFNAEKRCVTRITLITTLLQ